VRRIDGGYEVVLYTMFAPPGGLFFRGNPEDGYYTKTYDEPSPSEREEIDRAVDRFLEQERAVQWIEEGRAKNAAIAAKFWKEEA